MPQIQIKRVSETALILYLGDVIEPNNANYIAQICNSIKTQLKESVYEVIASYCSILVEFNILKLSYSELETTLYKIVHENQSMLNKTVNKCIILPVYYDVEVAPDLLHIATAKGITIEQVIKIHTQIIYSVCAIGFSPGFAFLASVDPRIAVPRLKRPRLLIPAGSVGIADSQTAVYPDNSPGGWQIIGNCPNKFFDPTTSPMMPFSVGDSVQFNAISKPEFLDLGGQICQNWK